MLFVSLPSTRIAVSGLKSTASIMRPRLFGNTQDDLTMNEMLLVVTVNWALDDGGEGGAASRLEELKSRRVEVEMP